MSSDFTRNYVNMFEMQEKVDVPYAWRTLADFCCKSGDLPTYAQKLSMYAGLRTC